MSRTWAEIAFCTFKWSIGFTRDGITCATFSGLGPGPGQYVLSWPRGGDRLMLVGPPDHVMKAFQVSWVSRFPGCSSATWRDLSWAQCRSSIILVFWWVIQVVFIPSVCKQFSGTYHVPYPVRGAVSTERNHSQMLLGGAYTLGNKPNHKQSRLVRLLDGSSSYTDHSVA